MEKQFEKMMKESAAKQVEEEFGYKLEEAEERKVVIKRPHREIEEDEDYHPMVYDYETDPPVLKKLEYETQDMVSDEELSTACSKLE